MYIRCMGHNRADATVNLCCTLEAVLTEVGEEQREGVEKRDDHWFTTPSFCYEAR